MDVGDWLRSLGLGQYQAAFRESGIDADVLPELTDADLEKLGVLLGHRKCLLKSIANLGAAASPPVGVIATANADAAERRQLTVMFCDLVGSTAMSTRLDPEDMRGVIGAYHKCCTSLIERNGGFVAKYMGDGVLAYFGYPQAHEHDAERAVRAGLAIVEAAPKLETAAGAPLHVRVGIATGIVVVGDLLGSGEAQERGVVGDTPNLAARLQGIAAPDSVVIAEGTRKLLGDLFELTDLGPQDLKGVAAPTRAYAALRESSQESRFEALHAGGLTPLVGREEETELLLRRWSRAKAGQGQVVLLSGEAGIGKSRLTAALLERPAEEPHTRMRYFCSPRDTDSALHPIIGHMERAARLSREDDAKTRLDKLDALLATSDPCHEDAALLAEMLSLANDGRYPELDLAPQPRRQKTLEALIGQIEAIARKAPVLMIFEDAHWADPSSLELLGRLVDKIDRMRVLLFVTFRPDYAAPWVGRPHVTALTIDRLAQREAMALIEQVAGNNPLPDSIRQEIVERADGIPLFVEEMTKAVLEAEGESAVARAIAFVPSPALAVPASLHAPLMARLDRLGPAKRLAQIGAAIGREFSHPLLALVAGQTEADLNSALDRLVQSGLLSRQGAPPDATYLFKHALVQDAAYGTLLRNHRQQLHALIAKAMEEEDPETAEKRPEILARHCAEARLDQKAIACWRAAGEQAVRRASNREAIGHFGQALALVDKQPLGTSRWRTELAILSQLGPALMSVHGWSAPEVGRAFERAEGLARQLESSVDLAPPLAGLWLFRTARGQFSRAEEITNELFNVAHDLDDPDVLLQAHHCAWPVQWFRGAFADAEAHADAGLRLYDSVRHERHRFLYHGHDPTVCALSIGSILQWLLGRPTQGLRSGREGIDLARRLKHAPSLAHALGFVCQGQIMRGDAAAVFKTANELQELSEENWLPQTRAVSLVYLGWALGRTKDIAQGLQLMEEGISAWNRLGIRSNLCLSICLLAETYFAAGR